MLIKYFFYSFIIFSIFPKNLNQLKYDGRIEVLKAVPPTNLAFERNSSLVSF